MKKRKSRFLSVALTAIMLLSSFPVRAEYDDRIASFSRRSDYWVNTPPEYTFQVEGSNKTFILLESGNGTNYILAKEHYKWTQFDPDGTQKFDIEDTNNIAYWLNNNFLLKDKNDKNKLPEEMLDYIQEYTYRIEPGAKEGNAPEYYEISTKISLLSATEWKQYYRRFGIVDSIPIYGWWLRTGSGSSASSVLWSINDAGNEKYYGDIGMVKGNDSRNYGGARPAFHLSDDFFKHNRVNLDTVGQVVKDELFAKMSYADFSVYTDDELRFLGVKDVPLRFRVKADDLVGGAYNMQEALPVENIIVMSDEAQVAITVCTNNNERISLAAYTVNGEAVFSLGEYGLIKSIETDGNAKEITVIFPDQSEKFSIRGGEEHYGAVSIRNIDAYDIFVNYSYTGVDKRGSFTVDMMSISSDGRVTSSWSPLCSDGGQSALSNISRRYALVERTDDSSLILFRTRLGQGEVSVNRFGIEKIEEKFSFGSDWEPYYLLESNNQKMTVKIKTVKSVPRKYTIEGKVTYRLDGEVMEAEPIVEEVKPDIESVGVLTFPKLKYGNANVEVSVYDGGRCAAKYSCEICVYKPYERHYFNKYTTGSINEMKSNRHPERPTQEIMDIANKLGFFATRMDPEWASGEHIKGIYRFKGMAFDYSKSLYDKSDFIWSPVDIDYNNALYSDGDQKGNIYTPSNLQGYADFSAESALYYDNVKEFEFWNEPNGNTYWKGADPYEYAAAVKTASSFMRQLRTDLNLSAGSIDVSKNGLGYSRTIFDAGIYDYIDNFSVHPYYHPQRGDGVFDKKTKSYMEIVENAGGWKDIDLTEIGWMGSKDGETSLDLQQAEEIPKIIAICNGLGVFYNIYCMYSKPANEFGFLRMDYSARPSCASTSNFFNNFGGAEYLFRYQPNDTAYIYCYKRDGGYTLVAWDSMGDTTLNLIAPAEVYDIYGNSLGKKTDIKLISAPQYIKNVDKGWIRERFAESIRNEIVLFTEKNTEILSDNIKEELAELSGKISPDINADVCELPYTIGLSIMEDKGDAVFDPQNKQMLYELHRIGELIIKLYGSESNNKETTAISEYNKLYNRYSSKLKYNTDKMPFTHDILRYAGRCVDELEYLLNDKRTTKDANMFISNRNIMAKQLMRWAEYTMTKETVKHLDMTFSMLPAQGVAIDGKDFKVDISVFNSTFEDKSGGKVEVINTEGTVVATIDNVYVPARNYTTVKTSFNIAENELNKEMFYTVRYTGGGYSYESTYPIKKTPQVNISMLDSEFGADQMREIKYELTNLMSEQVDMSLKVTAPEGWEVQENVGVTLKPNEKKVVSVPVNSIKQTAFNHYPINLEVIRDDGHVIYNETNLLNFTVSSRADTDISAAEFDGDISDWSNAYPYYIALPEDFNSGASWQDSELSGRVFSKYDDNNLYFLIDVYDETHSNTKDGVNIWDGDAVQIAFDVLDTNSGAYDGDDYEICAALTGSGVQVWNHFAGNRNNSGARPSEWAGIVRNNEQHTTRYLIKIPKSDITPFETRQGNSISLDIALADSDLLAGRESAASICGTITGRKDTIPFIKWYLIGTQEILKDGIEDVEKIFPIK